jgi:hypothetical protein
MIDKITEYYQDESFLKADGFDEAIIEVDENEVSLFSFKVHRDTL